MARVIFYTKTGCLTGSKQLELLERAGHEVEVRSVLDQPWTAYELHTYFADLPVKEWFNYNSPRVKSGEIDPGSFDEKSALSAMLDDKLLIRRPLLQVGSMKRCGFDLKMLDDWIGIAEATARQDDDFNSCSAKREECSP
jgi:nitrogenase-associated protein